jgi:hypothetical protein
MDGKGDDSKPCHGDILGAPRENSLPSVADLTCFHRRACDRPADPAVLTEFAHPNGRQCQSGPHGSASQVPSSRCPSKGRPTIGMCGHIVWPAWRSLWVT